MASNKNSEMDKYIDNGETVDESTKVYDKSVAQKGKSKWSVGSMISGVKGLVGEVKGAIDTVKGAYSDFQKQVADFSKKASLDGLLKKLGLSDSKLLKYLSSKFGLKSGLFDSWASDLLNAGMSFANTMLSDIGNGILQSLYTELNNANTFDSVILNSVVKPLRYTGANPNYKNTLLRCCLESDMPQCLEYLDGYNGTKYLHTNNMWKRGTYAAKHGSFKAAKYVCKQLNEELKKYDNTTATGNEDIAYWYKLKMIDITKTVLVYSYSNLTTDMWNDYTDVNQDLLRNYSYYGDNDVTFNKKFKFTNSDINVMAKIVNVNKFGTDENNKNQTKYTGGWNDPGAGTTIDVSNISHQVKYIDPRNGCIKQLYVVMANDVTSDDRRLVNQELHTRLKYPMMEMLSKSTSKMIDTMLKSKTYNDLRYLIDTNGDKNGEGFVAGLIHNSLKELQRVKALKTIDDIYRARTTINNHESDIGDFKPYVAPTDSNNTTTSISTSTNVTQSEEEQEIENIIKNNIVDDQAFKDIGLTSNDFRIINVTGMSPEDQTSVVTSILGSSTEFTLADTKTLKRYSNTTNAYDIEHTYLLYCKNTKAYSSTVSANKERIFKQLVAINLLKEYSSKYSIEALKSWYGETIKEPVYEKDTNGNIVYDASGNPNTLGYSSANTPDSIIKEFLDKFKDIAKLIKNYYSDKVGNTKYTITFDNQGIGQTPDPIRDISPYSTVPADYEPVTLTDGSKKYVFLGWAESFDSEIIFDFANSYISKNITLYALWEEANNYILEAKLLKENNSTLEETVYATIDHSTKSVYFPIKTKEKTSGSYIIDLTISKGATSTIVSGSTVFLSVDGNQTVVVTDIYGERYNYSLKLVEVPDDAKRIAYITKEGVIAGLGNNKLYLEASSQDINLSSLTCSRIGFNFTGWSLMSDNTGKIESVSYESVGSFTKIYPKLVENEYIITYNDKLGSTFSGKHEANYPTKFTYKKGAKLDTPEKTGYYFLGYYSDPACSGSSILRNIPKFYGQSNITVYASWVDQTLYDIQNNGISVDGYAININDITFYTRFITESGEQWAVTNTGLARYSSVGDKISQARVAKNNTPLGIAFVSNANIFLCVAKTAGGKINLYYSKDRGLTWTFAMEVTEFNIQFFVGTGFETLEQLSFFLRVLYNGILFELKNNKLYANDNLFLDLSTVTALNGKTVSGISVTLDGAFYLLIVGGGVFKLTFNDYYFNIGVADNPSNPDPETQETYVVPPEPENVSFELASKWKDTDNYALDTSSVGSAYNNVNTSSFSSELNDDFDIDDPEIIANILRNNADTHVVIRTFRNAGTLSYVVSSDGKTVPVYGPNDPGDWFWEVNEETINDDLKPPVLWLSGYNNKGKYIPDITNPVEEVTLERKDKPIIREVTVKSGNLYDYHEEIITPDNWKYYIGWNKKVDGDVNGLKLTQEYMNTYWNQPNKQKETWMVKIDKYEMINDDEGKPLYHKRFDEAYQDDENLKIVPSEDYNNYQTTNYGNEDDKRTAYYNMIKNEQKNTADAYKSKYTVTQNANGTTRYDGITEEFYKYITGDCKDDADKQETIYAAKHPTEPTDPEPGN